MLIGKSASLVCRPATFGLRHQGLGVSVRKLNVPYHDALNQLRRLSECKLACSSWN